MQAANNITFYQDNPVVKSLLEELKKYNTVHLNGVVGSTLALIAGEFHLDSGSKMLLVLNDKEEAAYCFNDLEHLIGKEQVLFFPASYQVPYENESETANANVIQRAEALTEISNGRQKVIVSYPQALAELVITQQTIHQNSHKIHVAEQVDMDFLIELLYEYHFEKEQFVTAPGQFAVRGGIIDLWSFSNERPYRIEFFGDEVESIRSFDPADQLSIKQFKHLLITPNIQADKEEQKQSILSFLGPDTVFWVKNLKFLQDKLDQFFDRASQKWEEIKENSVQHAPKDRYLNGSQALLELEQKRLVEFGNEKFFKADYVHKLNIKAPTPFNRSFSLLIKDLNQWTAQGFDIHIAAENPKQIARIESIFQDFEEGGKIIGKDLKFNPLYLGLHEGFIDQDRKILVYTDHQIFDRYHRFKLKDSFKKSNQALTIKELTGLKKGDYVTHIDYGIGIFDGLEKIDVNGKKQEAIRLRYKDQDVLYVNIQSLHRITKYAGKDAKPPTINKLGTNTWKAKKSATKKKVKEVAYDLIQLYAKRKSAKGHAYPIDGYLQTELEASFLFEDTPDQEKATIAVKQDMEKTFPMDRLVCGDVGFGKTEIAIRAAFKAACDGKQTAILVPTTILAFQHYQTFSKRLKDFPVKVDYINRFRSTKQIKESLSNLSEGKTDIIIGTHRLVGKDVKYNDLGLLIIDEEQKFGVSVKDKLKTLKANLDTLTLTATPIPRTLQFSLLGSRDLSVINTPPPNRHPVETNITGFNEDIIRDAIQYELSRGGQVYFIHNRVQNIKEVAGTLQRLVPDAKIGIGHGQMEGDKMEKILMDFMYGEFDVLVATTIIESGLDIPNANTIIINHAENFGLSDLHQMRGRVGRSNKKAFCYLLAPPASAMTDDARKRLRALEEFSDLGSGFNIAMRDLDIRGAGDLLGAEQSGFMAEIGYETYQKILDEAIQELKENEFKDLYKEELADPNRIFVRDCQIETDQEILIPHNYVNAVDERLSLYKTLDNLKDEEGLQQFRKELEDRFGPVPKSVADLFDAIRLRWLAIQIGFEKIRIKNGLLRCYFVSDPQSPYYSQDKFSKVLVYVQQNASKVTMKEIKEKLTLSYNGVDDLPDAFSRITQLKDAVAV